MNDLENARKIISETDSEMAKLFVQRMKAVEKVAEYKKANGLPIFDAAREAEMLQKTAVNVEDAELREYYVNYMRSVMDISKTYQRKLVNSMRVAYSGVPGAFGYIAAKRLYSDAELVSFDGFESAYKAVENGDCDCAVLPVENSYAGDVGAVMDLVFSGSLYINAMVDVAVVHNLLGKEGAKLEDIKTVTSHPQALSQCAEYISANGFSEVPCSNTAVAAQNVAEGDDVSVAAIASAETAQLYGLKVLETNINASRTNTTRFAVFSRSQHLPDSQKKIDENFILVFTVKHEAGALAKALDIIGAYNFNMRNLRSRPMKELLWNYYFYVEAEGNINTEDGRDMLKALGATCAKLKLVGTYKTV